MILLLRYNSRARVFMSASRWLKWKCLPFCYLLTAGEGGAVIATSQLPSGGGVGQALCWALSTPGGMHRTEWSCFPSESGSSAPHCIPCPHWHQGAEGQMQCQLPCLLHQNSVFSCKGEPSLSSPEFRQSPALGIWQQTSFALYHCIHSLCWAMGLRWATQDCQNHRWEKLECKLVH